MTCQNHALHPGAPCTEDGSVRVGPWVYCIGHARQALDEQARVEAYVQGMTDDPSFEADAWAERDLEGRVS